MKSDEALVLVKNSIPILLEKEYNELIKKIKISCEYGRKESFIGSSLPSQSVYAHLLSDGYKFYKKETYYVVSSGYYITWDENFKEVVKVKKQTFITKLKRLFKK